MPFVFKRVAIAPRNLTAEWPLRTLARGKAAVSNLIMETFTSSRGTLHPETERNGSVEFARFIAAIGIIWFHEQVPGGEIGLAGLSVFTVFVTYYAAQSSKISFVVLRIWAVWCAIYLFANLADVTLTSQTFADKFHWWMLATGPAIHLWFLPFAFVIGLIVKRGPPGYALLTLLTGVFFFANFEMKPLTQYGSVMPAVMVGIVMAISKNNKVAAAAAVLALGVTADISLILGGAVAALALIFPVRISWAVKILGRASLTMYLAHPAISAALKYAHLDPIPKAVAVVLASIAVAIILDHIPAKRLLALK